MASAAQAPQAGSVDNVVARIERIPTSWWHVKTRIIVGVATFFDAFDALAIATALPVLVPMWKLTPPQIGMMISAGFVGQLIGVPVTHAFRIGPDRIGAEHLALTGARCPLVGSGARSAMTGGAVSDVDVAAAGGAGRVGFDAQGLFETRAGQRPREIGRTHDVVANLGHGRVVHRRPR